MDRRMTIAGAALLACMTAACASLPGGRAAIERAPVVCQTINITLYFEQNSADVTDEARAVLRTASSRARGCEVDGVRVVGLADAQGAPDANLELSEARADAVTAALEAAGFRNAAFEVDAAGAAGSITSAGQAAPLRRRADIAITLSPAGR
jgi:peptidoglycan-associated lipoprotein